jgi:hypothetical protein
LENDGQGERPAPTDDLGVITVPLICSGALRPTSVAWMAAVTERRPFLEPTLDVLEGDEFALVLSATEAA